MKRAHPLYVAGAALLLAGAAWAGIPRTDRFDHPQHAPLFPLCTTCHVGAAQDGAPIMPSARSCEACHDGEVEERVDWVSGPPKPNNLRFSHLTHASSNTASPDTSRRISECAACHTSEGADRMTVRRPSVGQCLSCHRLGEDHTAVADSACGTCHRALAETPTLPIEQVAAFPTPASHDPPGFMLTGAAGHGSLATPSSGVSASVSASCATCHARDFCLQCHVDGPERPQIQALALDPRSLALAAHLRSPASHQTEPFLNTHGSAARRDGATCATCHTQPNCTACHVDPTPRAVQRLPLPGPGRAVGASVARRAPMSHSVSQFAQQHGQEAAASPTTCTSCHTRDSCLACHAPGAAQGRVTTATGGDFHPASFLVRHPVDAYRRSATCADCHQTGQFCAACHQQAGVTSRGALGTAQYHDGKAAFIFGHGPTARRALESCVGCHVERDCTTCHAAIGGRRFSPHGPGFDAARLRRKNPEMCVACHGQAIPGGS